MAEDIKLANYPTGMLDLYSLVKGYSDRSNKIPLAAALKQAPLNPEKGARFQGGGAMELGQENAKIADWNRVGPVTFPLRPPYQLDSFEEQWGSRKPMFPSAYEPSTKPSSELAGSDLIPPTPYLFYDAFSSDPTLESKQVSTSGVYFNPTQNLNFQAGEREGSQIYADQPSSWSSASYMTGGEEPVFSNVGQAALTIGAQTLQADKVSSSDTNGGYYSSALQLDVQAGSQSYSPNLVYEDVFYYPDAETALLPSKEGDRYVSANAVRPSTWSSAHYMSGGAEPVSSSHTGHWAHPAPVETPIYPTYVAPLYLDSTSSKLHSEGVDTSKYDSMNAVQPSTWSSASYMTREEEPVFSSHTGDWAHVAPVETPAYPSYVADFGLDSTSSKAAAQPVLFMPLKKAPQLPSSKWLQISKEAPQLPSSKWLQGSKKAPQLPSSKWLQRPKKVMDQSAATYLVQSKGGHIRGRQVFSMKKYFSGFPPPPASVLMAMKPKSETVRGKW
ncbi:unnamed protein product [Gadus morhua 'NCC']